MFLYTMDSGYSIYLPLFFFFRMDNIRVCVIYELGMSVWFVLYYVTNLDFGFVDFYTFIMLTVELSVYIIHLYYAMYLF